MTTPENVSTDPWEDASNAQPRAYEYFGQVKFDPWFAFFPGGGAQPIPFDPTQHDAGKKTTIVEAQIIPIEEQNITNEVKQSFASFSSDWTRIVLPSIKALPGVTGIRDIHDKFVRVSLVPGKRKRLDSAGNDTGDFWNTWKFMEIFPDKAACVAAYSRNGNSPTTEQQAEPAAPINGNASPEYQTALKFAGSVVAGLCKGKGAADFEAVKSEVSTRLATLPMINKFFTAESTEIQNLMMTELAK